MAKIRHDACVPQGSFPRKKTQSTQEEVNVTAGGERWTEARYQEMNVRYQEQTKEELRRLAKENRPFFLQYWPLYPLTGPRTTTNEYTTPNGGTYVEKTKLVDQWIGEPMAEIDELGITDSTPVIVMRDNGHFTKYYPQSGYTPMLFRGGKGDATKGGVHVYAFVRWPGMIEADSVSGDIVHVSDLFTTIARLGGATDEIPADRVIDGIDQTSLLLNGETHGPRDFVFIYNILVAPQFVNPYAKPNSLAMGGIEPLA